MQSESFKGQILKMPHFGYILLAFRLLKSGQKYLGMDDNSVTKTLATIVL
jgi:hypothetical protein